MDVSTENKQKGYLFFWYFSLFNMSDEEDVLLNEDKDQVNVYTIIFLYYFLNYT